MLKRLANEHPENRLVQRAQKVYAVYRDRSDPLASVRAILPRQERVVGFLADGDDMDISLWRPFYTRVVKHIRLGDSGEDIRKQGIRYAVVGGAYLGAEKVSLEDWMRRVNAELVGCTTATIKVTEGAQEWFLVRFR